METRGDVTVYNVVGSMYQVCTGFGTEASFEWTPARTCLLIAIAAHHSAGGFSGVRPAASLCGVDEVLEAYEEEDWLGYSKEQACNFFGSLLAAGLGGAAAGAAFPATGPGAAAVGVAIYRAIGAGPAITCAGLFGGEYVDLGEFLEARHHENIATDIALGKCLSRDTSSRCNAVECPD